MDENVMKLCEDLDAFALIYNQMADCDSKIYQNNEVGIESYIVGKIGLKPKKLDVPIYSEKVVNEVIEHRGKKKIQRVIVLGVITVVVFIFEGLLENVLGVLAYLLGPALMIVTLALFFFRDKDKDDQNYNIRIKRQKEEIDKKAKALAAIEYNENTYPKDLAEYNKKHDEAKKEYDVMIQETINKRKQLSEELSKYDGLLPESYQRYASRISSILRNYRADSIKEAINILVDDLRQEESIRRIERQAAQQQAMAEQQLAADRKRQQLDEYYAKQRADFEQLKLDKQQDEFERQMKQQQSQMERMQKEAMQAQRDRQLRLKGASEAYKSAANNYNVAMASGKTLDAGRYKKQMDEAYADMLKNQ